jgi:hypothetical protein
VVLATAEGFARRASTAASIVEAAIMGSSP